MKQRIFVFDGFFSHGMMTGCWKGVNLSRRGGVGSKIAGLGVQRSVQENKQKTDFK